MGPPQPHASSSRRRTIVVAFGLLCTFAVVPAMSTGAHTRAKEDPPPVPQDKVVICHRDSNPRKPYGPKAIEVSVDSIVKDKNGHATHTGPVWRPPPDTPDEWGDIIPPFWYVDDGVTKHFDGLNWSEGFGVYQNDCQPPYEPTPQTTLAVVKELSPPDSGRFALKINGKVEGGASAVGNQGTTGKVSVDPGNYTVSESPGEGSDTDLGDFTIRTICRRGNETVAQSNGPSVDGVPVREGDEVTCVISNTLRPPADSETVAPVLECVVFNEGKPDIAVWGYNNRNGHPVTLPIGPSNRFTPDPEGRGQPTTFEAGRVVGIVQTPFEAGVDTLTWRLAGNEASASTDSRRCNATVEVRKIVIPADDPGVFQLRVNGSVAATGGNGTTTGQVVVGVGEATASETAGPGTNLADYDSSVECTRNGAVAGSAAGTKLDAAVAGGDVVVCTFTNRRRAGGPTPPQPPLGHKLDLLVTKSVEPDTVVVGGRLTWTMIVTNRSSVAATDVNGVKVNDPRSFRTRLISLRASQGTCAPYTCNLGRLAPGASATVTAVTEATQEGVVVDIVRVSSEEQESNYRNNVAAALAEVVGRLTPPFVQSRCDTLTVAPRVLQNGRSSVVLLTALNGRGRPVAGIRVHVRGPGVDTTVTTDRRGIVRRTVLPRRAGLFHFTGLPRTRTGGGMHCRTLLGVLGASDTRVTG